MKKLLFFTQKDLAFWTMRVNNAQMLMSREALFPHCSSPDMHDLGQLEVQSEGLAAQSSVYPFAIYRGVIYMACSVVSG